MLLVENSVDGNGSLADLMIINDKLMLAMTNWCHDIHWLETGHHGLVDRMAGKDTGCLQGGTMFDSLNGALAVDGVTQGIDNMAKESRTNRNIDNLAGIFHSVTLLDEMVITEDGDTDVVRLQVETHATNARREFHHLHGC